jgi:GT2 family glycosyltransferase/glycosyltransferase involved in cell wall biosynthesis
LLGWRCEAKVTGTQLRKGRIDECRGRYIFGWAIAAEAGAHCVVSVTDATGAVVAGAVADIARADLAAVGNGRSDFAFQVAVPLGVAPGPVQVLADGTAFPESPLHLDEGVIDGGLSVKNGVVSGWICSRGTVPATKPVTLIDQDGAVVLSLPTRLDPEDADPLFRPGRFSAALPASCFGRPELVLRARVGAAIVAACACGGRLEGFLDRIGATGCVGWLFSPDAPDRTFDVAVYRDGVLAGTGRTTIARPDVAERHPGAVACGFDFAMVPDHRVPGGLTHVSIRLAGSMHELFGGPFRMGSAGQAVESALGGDAQAVQREAMEFWLRSLRTGDDAVRIRARPLAAVLEAARRLTIVIPCYGDVAATRVCFESVLRTRRPGADAVVIVNDHPGDAALEDLVHEQSRHPDVFVLRNDRNLGFVESVNRALAFVRSGDVLLLNADTEVFAGAFDEMLGVLHAAADIGTVTALSSNATLFSYPHPAVIAKRLEDVSWAELAAVALRENAGAAVSVPTAHGFCMLIRRETLDEIGLMDTAFGRGYGEENDFSLRASDRGWRHVLACGALVRHDEAGSFGAEKYGLVAANLAVLAERFPEYDQRVRVFAAADPVRRLRWPLDFYRLRRFVDSGVRLELVVANWLEGGTEAACADISAVVHAGETVHALRLTCAEDGALTLQVDALAMRAVFRPEDVGNLFRLLGTLALERVVVHQLLGFTADFVRALRGFLVGQQSIFHVHDYYYACPRVTLIDASGGFCGGAAVERCARCLALSPPHAADRLAGMTPTDHRLLFQDVLGAASHVIAPSQDAAARLAAMIPGVRPVAVPHPQAGMVFPIGVRRGTAVDVCLLGAVGPHKGSAALLALARHARLNHPAFRFHVIGHTDIDHALLAVGNVTVSGKYGRADLAGLVEATGARVALFLHGWPETFSYTLTEAVGLGLIPVVPDIGAPAERVREAGFGVVVPFPIDIEAVMAALRGIGDGTVAFSHEGALPLGFDTTHTHGRLRSVYHGGALIEAEPVPRKRRRTGSL